MTMRPAFRAANIYDLPAIESLLTAMNLPTAGVGDLMRRDASQFVVATASESSPDIVAVAGLEVCCNHALLRSVAVQSEWQRHGLGRELVKRVVCDAESRGIHALYLLTMTAEYYFPRFGFERVDRNAVPSEIAETLEFKSACPASAVAMKRALVP